MKETAHVRIPQNLRRWLVVLAVWCVLPLSVQAQQPTISAFTEFRYPSGEVRRVPIAQQDGVYVVHKRQAVGLPEWHKINLPTTHDVVRISGIDDPYARITLTLLPAKQTAVVNADSVGTWELQFDVDELENGLQEASLRREGNTHAVVEQVVAQFSVQQQDELSASTWMALIMGGGVIILTLLCFNVWFWMQRRQADLFWYQADFKRRLQKRQGRNR